MHNIGVTDSLYTTPFPLKWQPNMPNIVLACAVTSLSLSFLGLIFTNEVEK